MATIPLEIIYNGILPRFPAKSLKRFKCVSKPWLALISSHEFIRLHLRHALSSNTNNLLILTRSDDSSLYSCNLDDLPESRAAVKLPSFGVEPFVVGSCNGLLCIQSYRPYCLVLLNPSTGSHRKIPSLLPPRRCSALNFGFGYDSKNDDYRVVRIVDRSPSFGLFGYQVDRIVQVYSLKTNSWEVIEWTSPHGLMGNRENGTLLNNSLLHWKFWCSQEGRHWIRCLDLCEKQWTHDVPLPEYTVRGSSTTSSDHDGLSYELLDFGVVDGRLFLSTKNQKHSSVDIWVMNEYGVKESWVKWFKISDSRVCGSTRVTPIAYQSLKRQILIRTVSKTEHKVLWYNIDEGEAADGAEISQVADCVWIDLCKDSLLDVPGGSQVGTTSQ